ncbi:MAG TPA: PfkB family carbohydrate kinase [Candidatus Limnocylindrales bacterium]|nr:PfkB family carbohydrate kinase [Candidatus Limnocylindrales bacterium]
MSSPPQRRAIAAVRPRIRAPRRPRVTVLGDLMLDVVVAPGRPLESGTDVPGRVLLRQGGSAANTARWLSRLGLRTTLVCAVGRDPVGRALVDAVHGDGVTVRAARVTGRPSGRIGVMLGAGGERSFVADRGAADELRPADLREAWFRGDALHLPAYSLIGEPLAQAGRRAIELARASGALVSLDLASAGPLLARGRREARRLVSNAAPDLLFATATEAEAYLGGHDLARLLEAAPLAVVKRGSAGATVLARSAVGAPLRFDVATPPLSPTDTTGAGDAFDAGFLAAFLSALPDVRMRPAGLRRAALAAHRAAARQLASPVPEVNLG